MCQIKYKSTFNIYHVILINPFTKAPKREEHTSLLLTPETVTISFDSGTRIKDIFIDSRTEREKKRIIDIEKYKKDVIYIY